jgi:hypothetical protein
MKMITAVIYDLPFKAVLRGPSTLAMVLTVPGFESNVWYALP